MLSTSGVSKINPLHQDGTQDKGIHHSTTVSATSTETRITTMLPTTDNTITTTHATIQRKQMIPMSNE